MSIYKHLTSCDLCPRRCGIDRTAGETGYCGAGLGVRAARAALHHWEEPCISGERGAGAVFFSGCSLRCEYCQNYDISRANEGTELPDGRLAEIFLELQEQGAHNIDLVTPTHYSAQIYEVLRAARAAGLTIPAVYNTGGYESADILAEFEGMADVYMPDFKYMRTETADMLSHAADYPETAKKALAEMVRQHPACVYDDEGIMISGVLVRHLVLPGHTKESIEVLHYLADTYGDSICISLLNQYTPMPQIAGGPLAQTPLKRRVTRREYDKVVDAAIDIGLTQVYIQEGSSAQAGYIPDFDGTGIIRIPAGHTSK